MSQETEIIEIGQPVFDPAIDAEAGTDEQETGQARTEHIDDDVFSANDMAKGIVDGVAMVSMGATAALKVDVTLTEDEGEKLERATARYLRSLGDVDMPPWLTLLFTVGGLLGGKYMVYMTAMAEMQQQGQQEQPKEKVVNPEQF